MSYEHSSESSGLPMGPSFGSGQPLNIGEIMRKLPPILSPEDIDIQVDPKISDMETSIIQRIDEEVLGLTNLLDSKVLQLNDQVTSEVGSINERIDKLHGTINHNYDLIQEKFGEERRIRQQDIADLMGNTQLRYV